MDHQTFDRLTHLFAASGSRRAAWRALLSAALLGVTMRSAAAKPCNKGKHLCGDTCCPGKCFVNDCGGQEICCTGKDRIICGNICCKSVDARGNPIADPCRQPCTAPDQIICPSGIAGSYRRR